MHALACAALAAILAGSAAPGDRDVMAAAFDALHGDPAAVAP